MAGKSAKISPLFTLSVKVILQSCTGERACKTLPPPMLHYLMYRAVTGKIVSLVQELVRFWPTEILSFDFEKFFDEQNITGDIYLRKYHSWFHSSRDPSLKLTLDVAIAIANGLYLRCCDCGSELATAKQLHVDLSMVGLGEYLFDEEDKKLDMEYLQLLINLCNGKPPVEQSAVTDKQVFSPDTKVLVDVNKYCDQLFSCLNTHPCAVMPRHVEYLSADSSVVINSLCAMGNIRSLHCVIKDLKSVLEFEELLTVLQEQHVVLNEIVVFNHITGGPTYHGTLGAQCRRLKFVVSHFTSLFNCAYHSTRKLQSLHVNSIKHSHRLKFCKELSDIIKYNSESLVDLCLLEVTVLKNMSLLCETLQSCRQLVVLQLFITSEEDYRSLLVSEENFLSHSGLHKLFASLEGLPNIEFLKISSPFMDVFGEDVLALHNLLHQHLPQLRRCHLIFSVFVVHYSLLKDSTYGPILDLLHTLLPDKKTAIASDTVAFKWSILQTWMSAVHCDVDIVL